MPSFIQSVISSIFHPKVLITLIALVLLLVAVFTIPKPDHSSNNTKKENEGFRGSIKYSKYKR
jgi:hypothetical protein